MSNPVFGPYPPPKNTPGQPGPGSPGVPPWLTTNFLTGPGMNIGGTGGGGGVNNTGVDPNWFSPQGVQSAKDMYMPGVYNPTGEYDTSKGTMPGWNPATGMGGWKQPPKPPSLFGGGGTAQQSPTGLPTFGAAANTVAPPMFAGPTRHFGAPQQNPTFGAAPPPPPQFGGGPRSLGAPLQNPAFGVPPNQGPPRQFGTPNQGTNAGNYELNPGYSFDANGALVEPGAGQIADANNPRGQIANGGQQFNSSLIRGGTAAGTQNAQQAQYPSSIPGGLSQDDFGNISAWGQQTNNPVEQSISQKLLGGQKLSPEEMDYLNQFAQQDPGLYARIWMQQNYQAPTTTGGGTGTGQWGTNDVYNLPNVLAGNLTNSIYGQNLLPNITGGAFPGGGGLNGYFADNPVGSTSGSQSASIQAINQALQNAYGAQGNNNSNINNAIQNNNQYQANVTQGLNNQNQNIFTQQGNNNAAINAGQQGIGGMIQNNLAFGNASGGGITGQINGANSQVQQAFEQLGLGDLFRQLTQGGGPGSALIGGTGQPGQYGAADAYGSILNQGLPGQTNIQGAIPGQTMFGQQQQQASAQTANGLQSGNPLTQGIAGLGQQALAGIGNTTIPGQNVSAPDYYQQLLARAFGAGSNLSTPNVNAQATGAPATIGAPGIQGSVESGIQGQLANGGLSPQYVQAMREMVLKPQQEALTSRLNAQGGGVANLNSPYFLDLQRKMEQDFQNQLIISGQNNYGNALAQGSSLGAQQFGQGATNVANSTQSGQFNAQQQLQAALANQNSGLQTQQLGVAAGLQGLGLIPQIGGQNLQGQIANQGNALNTGTANSNIAFQQANLAQQIQQQLFGQGATTATLQGQQGQNALQNALQYYTGAGGLGLSAAQGAGAFGLGQNAQQLAALQGAGQNALLPGQFGLNAATANTNNQNSLFNFANQQAGNAINSQGQQMNYSNQGIQNLLQALGINTGYASNQANNAQTGIGQQMNYANQGIGNLLQGANTQLGNQGQMFGAQQNSLANALQYLSGQNATGLGQAGLATSLGNTAMQTNAMVNAAQAAAAGQSSSALIASLLARINQGSGPVFNFGYNNGSTPTYTGNGSIG